MLVIDRHNPHLSKYPHIYMNMNYAFSNNQFQSIFNVRQNEGVLEKTSNFDLKQHSKNSTFGAHLWLADHIRASNRLVKSTIMQAPPWKLQNILIWIGTWANIFTRHISDSRNSECILCTKGRCHSTLSKINKNRSHDVILIQIMGVIS